MAPSPILWIVNHHCLLQYSTELYTHQDALLLSQQSIEYAWYLKTNTLCGSEFCPVTEHGRLWGWNTWGLTALIPHCCCAGAGSQGSTKTQIWWLENSKEMWEKMKLVFPGFWVSGSCWRTTQRSQKCRGSTDFWQGWEWALPNSWTPNSSWVSESWEQRQEDSICPGAVGKRSSGLAQWRLPLAWLWLWLEAWRGLCRRFRLQLGSWRPSPWSPWWFLMKCTVHGSKLLTLRCGKLDVYHTKFSEWTLDKIPFVGRTVQEGKLID